MAKIRLATDGTAHFECPGCDCMHGIRIKGETHPVWGWNGSMDAPTFTPSILIRSGHFDPGRTSDKCWCTYNAEHPDEPAPFKCSVCHSFVTDGKIQFLGDCTHALAGQTVELPEVE